MSVFKNNRGLFEDFVRGDPAALDRVYREYADQVARYLRALARASGRPDLQEPWGAADLLQETFIRAFSERARSQYDASMEYGPYLATIARNCFVDTLRRQKRWSAFSEDERLPELVAEAAEGGGTGWSPGLLEAVRSYVSELPPKMKGVYEQRYVLGRSQELAGTELGITRSQLRTVERNLTARLRKRLIKAGLAMPPRGATYVPEFLCARASANRT